MISFFLAQSTDYCFDLGSFKVTRDGGGTTIGFWTVGLASSIKVWTVLRAELTFLICFWGSSFLRTLGRIESVDNRRFDFLRTKFNSFPGTDSLDS